MQATELKKLNEDFYEEVFRRKHVDAVDDMLSDDFVEHTPAPGQATDRQGTKDFIGQMLQAFPDIAVRIDHQIAEGDTVAAIATMTGTHRGDFLGVPATGKKVSVQIMDTARGRGGKFTEHWGLVDTPALMAQLGVPGPTR